MLRKKLKPVNCKFFLSRNTIFAEHLDAKTIRISRICPAWEVLSLGREFQMNRKCNGKKLFTHNSQPLPGNSLIAG